MSLAKKPLLVPTGDPAGVGPEISLKAASGCGWPCVLFGDAARLAGSGFEIVDTGALPEAVVSAAGPTDVQPANGPSVKRGSAVITKAEPTMELKMVIPTC